MKMANYNIVFTVLFICCGTTLGFESYNTQKEICCNGTVQPMLESGMTSCCGTETYDRNQMACCSGEVVPLYKEGSYSYGCCESEDGSPTVTYDHEASQCCDGKVLDKPKKNEWYGCCNGKLHNYTEGYCCGGSLISNELNISCCVDTAYDTETQTCCEDWSDLNDKMLPNVYHILDKDGTLTSCCGTQLYDPDEETCCQSKLSPKVEDLPEGSWTGCCDGVSYDASKKVCCNKWDLVSATKWDFVGSKLHDIEGKRTSCCGLEAFNYQTEVCCDETVVPKPEGSDEYNWFGCCGNQIIPDHQTHACINGELVKRSETQVQCGDQLLDGEPGKICCYQASQLYDYQNELCCNEVRPITEDEKADGKNACCTLTFYGHY